MHHFKDIGESKLELQSGNAQIGSKLEIFFVPCDFTIWRITFKNNRSPLLCYFKLCASFCGHWWIKSGETPNLCQNWRIVVPCDLEIWRLILKKKEKNIAPLPWYFQLFVSFRSHLWIHSGVMVRKWPDCCKIWFDLDLRPLTVSFCMDITPDIGNYSWKFYKNGQCERRTDRYRTFLRAAKSRLKGHYGRK